MTLLLQLNSVKTKMTSPVVELDGLEITVIIDNELDVMSPPPPDTVQSHRTMGNLVLESPHRLHDRGGASAELQMGDICCAAHGLSVLVTGIKGDERRTMLFDTGPEEDIWARNVRTLKPDLASVERIQLSHWHRDHSGGMPMAIRSINTAKEESSSTSTSTLQEPVVVDVHPGRPDYRGMKIGSDIISLEADPTFQEMEDAGARVEKNDTPHTVLDNMFLVSGEIPRVTEYETGVKHGVRFDTSTGRWGEDELILDERLLACRLKDKGIVVFTGCSHAGVVNATKHAVDLIGKNEPVYAVFGGYHLATGDKSQVQATVRDLKELDPKMLLPGHCSGWRVKYEIETEMPGRLVPPSVGAKLTF